jgi:hypothetical protein
LYNDTNNTGTSNTAQTPNQDQYQSTTNTSAQMALKVVVDNPHYSFILPSGWESNKSTTGQGVQATKVSEGYILSNAITPIPSNAGDITSIDQIMTPKTIPTIIDSEFSGAKISTSTSGYLGGEPAAVITFTGTATSSDATGVIKTKQLAMKQYSAVHKGTLYTLVFIVDLGKGGGTSAVQDLKEIVDSFQFK